MKRITLFFFSLLIVATTGFAENLTLWNQTSYPNKSVKSQIAVQWASSAKEVAENNNASIQGLEMNPDSMQTLPQGGKINLSIPDNAEYFRVIVWSKGGKDPDYLTNWVDVVPNKTYELKADHLTPSVLMTGMGC
jgi:hypothetical protein